jgi:hypothetical protein
MPGKLRPQQGGSSGSGRGARSHPGYADAMTMKAAVSIPEVLDLLPPNLDFRAWPSVREYFPSSLQQYARVLHPARHWPRPAFRWSTFASDTPITAETKWSEVLDDTDTSPFPDIHGVDVDLARELAATLAPFTATPDNITFMTWTGYGGLNLTLGLPIRTTISQDREMYILNGDINDASAFVDSDRTPQWWIPADGAWAVGNDIYGASVYVAGSPRAIDAVLSARTLEAISVSGSDRLIAEELD